MECKLRRVYAVTAHELAHWAHWYMDKGAFVSLASGAYAGSNNGKEAVIESWASGVEWRFAQERYENKFGITGYEYGEYFNNGKYQRNTIESKPIYTTLVTDMIDDENQRFTRGNAGNVAYPIDNVSGFTIQQVEQGLRGARSWNAWRDNMKNIDSSQEDEIDELFANWY